MTASLASSKYSIKHAKRRIDEFKSEVEKFLGGKPSPYAHVVDVNAERTEDTHKLKLVRSVPDELPGIAMDLLNALRSALDQTGHACAVAVGKTGNKAKFPFGQTEIDVQHRRDPKAGSVQLPKEIFDLMASFKPYKGGNNLLWALNNLANTKKHEIIVPAAVYVDSGDFVLPGDVAIAFATWPPRWDRVKNEMILFRVPHGHKQKYNFKYAMTVLLQNIEGIAEQPAVSVFSAMAAEAERIVLAVEAEARRLGIPLTE
jgi:hypothetical protein